MVGINRTHRLTLVLVYIDLATPCFLLSGLNCLFGYRLTSHGVYLASFCRHTTDPLGGLQKSYGFTIKTWRDILCGRLGGKGGGGVLMKHRKGDKAPRSSGVRPALPT